MLSPKPGDATPSNLPTQRTEYQADEYDAHRNGLKINSADYNGVQVDGGGFTYSSGDGYELSGTIGRPDAGEMAGGGYTLGGGFWRGGAVVGNTYRVYLPLVLRQAP